MSLPAFLSTHDIWLFAAALALSLGFGTAILHLAPRRPFPRFPAGAGRIVLSGGLLGTTIWIVFVVSWKGFFPFVDATIPALAGMASLALAVAGAITALAIAAYGEPGMRGSVLAGSILAASASCMLFIIMSALAAPLVLGYDLPRVLLSMIGCTLLCSFGLHKLRHSPPGASG